MHRTARQLTLSIGLALLAAVVADPALAQKRPGKAPAEQPAVPTGPQATKPFVKPLSAAQEQINQGKFEEALATLDKADALPDKTPGDQYYIDNLKATTLLQLKRLPEAAAIYEKVLATGLLPPEQAARTLQLVARIYGGVEPRQWAKSADYGSQYLAVAGTTDREALELVTIAHYQANRADKCEKALRYGEEAVKAAAAEQGKPAEGVLQILQRCYAAADDAANTTRLSMDLVRNYPEKRAYWASAASMLKRGATKSDAQTLNVYRLIMELDLMDSAQEYIQMAQLARDFGLPGEAESVMRKGLADSELFKDAREKTQGQQMLDDAVRLAREDRKELPRLETEAKANKAGVADVILGEAFLSYAENDKAVEALRRGIGKGSLKDPAEADLLLGKALFRQGNASEAAASFAKVTSGDLAQLAQLWGLLATAGPPAD
jgi:hypothetical protein